MPSFRLTLARPSLRSCVKVGLWTLASPVIATAVMAVIVGLMYAANPSYFSEEHIAQMKRESAEAARSARAARGASRPARKGDELGYVKYARWVLWHLNRRGDVVPVR